MSASPAGSREGSIRAAPPHQSATLAVEEPSQVGEARRVAGAMAAASGLGETARGRAALIATEAASNLIKHAGGGALVLRSWAGGLDLLALDRGPGMGDLGRCMADGYSTAGSSGNGLGAIGRMADLLDVDTAPGRGTAIFARILEDAGHAPDRGEGLEIGVVCLPVAGEDSSGDSWATQARGGRQWLMVADGLGHGPLAAEPALEALRAFREHAEAGPADVLRLAHERLRGTRGAAMAVAEVDRVAGQVRFAGVGNVAGSLFDPAGGRSVSMPSHNGIVGHQVHKIQEFRYPWPAAGLMILHSDGLATQWRLDRAAGLPARHPGLVAGVLCRDHRRIRDDVTVLAARESTEGPP